MNEFYITVLSDSSFNMFPNNTLASFQTQLPQPVNLGSDKWSVGLAEISYPTGVDIINSPLQFDEDALLNFVYITEQKFVGFAPLQNGKIVDIYKSLIKSFSNEGHKKYFLIDFDKAISEYRKEVNFMLASGQKWISRRSSKVWANTNHIADVNIHIPVRRYAGIRDLLQTLKNCATTYDDFKKVLNSLYTAVDSDLNKLDAVTAISPYTSHDTDNVFVYTDIIEPQIVGGVYTRCLRIIQLPQKHHVFNPIYYYPVQTSSFQTIGIDLRNKFGESPLFSDSLKPCIAVLHFKRS